MVEIDSKLEEAQTILDAFENQHILKIQYDGAEIQTIMSLDLKQLELLSVETCANYSYILSQYALYIQKVYNNESSKLKWINNKILDLVCDKLNDYDQYTKYEIKLRLIAKENEIVARLLKLQNLTEQKLDRINFIASNINILADKMVEIKRAKTNYNRG